MPRFSLLIAAFLLTAAQAIAANLPEFPQNSVWRRDITTNAQVSANSASMIAATGGWGNGNKFQIDQSMHVLHVSAANESTVPMADVAEGPDGYNNPPDPDCEPIGGLKFPLPAGGAIEGSTNYSCDNGSDDCHLFVALDGSQKLYESYQSNKNASGQLESGCVIIWDLKKVYPPQGRGEQCTSADAAGFPMAPLLFNADEIFAASQVTNGDIGHAIRFILPNGSMASLPPLPMETRRQGLYVHPASHAGGPSGPTTAIPYGSRLRLHSNLDISGYNAAAQVVLRTMKRYGIVLADGGNIALTAEDDTYTTHKWSEFGFDENNVYLEQMLVGIHLTDFDVVETGPQIPVTFDCVRVPNDFIFIDGYDF